MAPSVLANFPTSGFLKGWTPGLVRPSGSPPPEGWFPLFSSRTADFSDPKIDPQQWVPGPALPPPQGGWVVPLGGWRGPLGGAVQGAGMLEVPWVAWLVVNVLSEEVIRGNIYPASQGVIFLR